MEELMSNVNETLLKEIETYVYNNYGCDRYEIEHFLTHHGEFLEKQREAIRIIESIMTIHGKKRLLRHVVELARVEHGIRELERGIRDHVVHALLSFILGIYLNEKFLKPLIGFPVDDFQWKLAGLLHDVGYPAPIARDILRPFTEKINEIKRDLGFDSPDVFFKFVPVGLENLANDLNAFDLIQECLNKWELRIKAREEYNSMIATGDICHGMISSLAVLYVIDLMYQKYNSKREYTDIYAVGTNINWNQIYFERDIIPACSAIYIHNLPNKCFADAKIDPLKAPLAFLLKLSDYLQEWERPSFTNQQGFSAAQFDIIIDNGQIIFHADIPDDKKKKIKDEISSSLVAPNVHIN